MPSSYLKIGGELLQDALLSSVEIVQELNQHWWCTVVCRQTEDKRFPVEDCMGKDMQIVTYDQDGAELVVFDGFVLEGEIEYEVFGSYGARLLGVTRSYKIDLAPRHAYYLDKTFDDVAQKLAGDGGLEVELACDTDGPLDYVQWAETDFGFLKRLADDHGCWLRPTAKGIQIMSAFQEGTTLQWRGESGEKGIISFKMRGRLSQPSFSGAMYHAPTMESRTYDGVSDEPQFYGSSAPLVDAIKNQSRALLPSGYLPSRSRAGSLDEYEAALKKESVRSIGGKITGCGVSRNPLLTPGNTVDIQGVLDAKGVYGVTRVVHRWEKIGYLNEFGCTPWKGYTSAEAPSTNPSYGIVPARVTDNVDPEGRGRIQVQFYWQGGTPSDWVRMVTPHAGADRGFYFMPEIGDEVMVAFQEGDPERPVVLGCVWNGVDKAPTQDFWGGEFQNNDVKRIVTKSGHRIQLVDKEGKESIVIATPNYLKISLIEKTDETGRSMITLHSENGDIFLSAPNGRIHLRGKYFSREVG